MKPLLIFGDGPECACAVHEAERSGTYEVVGVVMPALNGRETFSGKPVFETAAALARFARGEVMAFAAGGSHFLNQDRFGCYIAAKRAGFRIATIVSASASVAADVRLRENVFVDSGVRILGGVQLGENAWVMKGAAVGPDVRIGRSCWIGEGAALEQGAVLGRNCTLTQNVVVRAGVALPAWSLVNQVRVIESAPASTVFFDPLFPEPVVLRGASGNATR